MTAAAWRPVLGAFLGLILATGILAAGIKNRAGDPGGPAGLLLSIDTLRADYLGCYGFPMPTSPGLDRLSRQARLYERAFCQIPITTPSHASILTGLYPNQHAVRGQAYSMDRSVSGLPDAARERGMETAAFVSAFPLDSRFGLDRGFAVYDDEFAGSGPVARIAPIRLAKLLIGSPEIERSAFATNRQVDHWLRRHGRSPYFLWVHYFDPHGPYDPPSPERELFLSATDHEPLPPPDDSAAASLKDVLPPDLARENDLNLARLAYAAEIAATDRAASWLLRRAQSLREGDLEILVLSDHGESLTEHGAWFRHGEELYDPALQIPLIWAGPQAGLAQELFETVQIAPRLAARLGLGWSGQSAGERPAVFSESTSAAVHYRPRKVIAVRTGDHKLIRGAEDAGVELYDLRRDPGETEDLSRRAELEIEALSAILQDYEVGSLDPKGDIDRATIEKLKALGYLK